MALLSASAQQTAAPAWQIAAGRQLSFDVASIRPSEPGKFTPPNFDPNFDDSWHPTGGTYTADFPLTVYVEFAWKLPPSPGLTKAMLASLPKWVSTQAFTIHAKATGNPTKDQVRLMFQSLLEDRFKLQVHFETQELPVLAMTLDKPGKLGPKLLPHSDGPPCDAHGESAADNHDIPAIFPAICNYFILMTTKERLRAYGARDTTLNFLAEYLSVLPGHEISRPVIDQTGLTGRYDFLLEWAPEPGNPPPGADAPTPIPGPTLLEALTDQLGLKLKPVKAVIPVLIIDHVEMPSPN